MLSWEQMRRVYLWFMTQHQKGILKCHRDVLFGAEAIEKHGKFDEERIFQSTSLLGVDKYYTRSVNVYFFLPILIS